MSMTGFPANVGTKDNPVWGVKMKQPASPGDVVSVTTKAGKPIGSKRLISVHKEWGDAVDWVAEDVSGNGAGQPAQTAAPAGPPAAPAPSPAPASTGPAGAVKASDLLSAALSAYVEATTGPAQVPAEQAGSIACTIAIQVGRGAVNDLADVDPFGG